MSRNMMTKYLLKRAKNGLVFSIIFFAMSIYFYVDNDMKLTQLLFIVGLIQLGFYIIYRYLKSKK